MRLVEARHLFGRKGKKPCTFVEMECEGQIEASSVRKGNDPLWDEKFYFEIRNPENSSLKLKLIDEKSDKVLARLKVPLQTIIKKGNLRKKYDLEKDTEMDLDLFYGKSKESGEGFVEALGYEERKVETFGGKKSKKGGKKKLKKSKSFFKRLIGRTHNPK